METILMMILILILVIYISLMSYLMINVYLSKKSQNIDEIKDHEPVDKNIGSPSWTNFFNESAEHAQKVLFKKIFIQKYGEDGYYGNGLMDIVNKLNDETKKNIMIAIKYMAIEPSSARGNEKMLRAVSEQEKVPLWFIILRDATKKVVPDFFQEQAFSEGRDNVIPLFKVA